jgi:UDP-N-acetylglucosamine 2-epimerase (non-hydrolysing)
MAPVVKELKGHRGRIATSVCVTAQHREMLDQVLELFDIRPDFDLDIMQENQSLADLTADALSRIDRVLLREKPDWVLTQGDTTTAMTATLAAFYRRVKVGHVEAGLRTGDRFHPFPEEVNRKVADGICDLHFAPTEAARQNLLREGVNESSITMTGNTVIDALLDIVGRPYVWGEGPLSRVPRHKRLILLTAHRRENFGRPLENICAAVKALVARFADIHVVCPVHLNPNVRRVIRRALGHEEQVTLLDPVEYLPMAQLLKHCYLVLTDSGGLQEEAPGLGKPVLVLREVTERPEGVEAGTARVVGMETQNIIREVARLLESPAEYERMARLVNPYGDGKASARIVSRLLAEATVESRARLDRRVALEAFAFQS